MHDKLFAAALGIQAPWAVTSVRFDEAAKVLTVDIDFKRGSRFAVPGHEGVHPVHDTLVKEYRHLNFFQHECLLRVRVPRVWIGAADVMDLAAYRGAIVSSFARLRTGEAK